MINAAGGYKTRVRSPALALYAMDTQRLDVKAGILKRRVRYLVRYAKRDLEVRECEAIEGHCGRRC